MGWLWFNRVLITTHEGIQGFKGYRLGRAGRIQWKLSVACSHWV